MEDQNNCPNPGCGRPESTHRWSAGKKLSICGNGHSWDAQAIADQRAKAKAAERQEIKIKYREPSHEEIERMKRRLLDSPFLPSGNPFK
jgi:hypothetical protein